MKAEQIVEIGMVADDMKRVVSEFEKIGLIGWEFGEFDTRMIPESRIDGEEQFFVIKSAILKMDNLAIEVIEPQGDSFYADFLKEHGNGIHHIALKTKENYKSFVEEFLEQGGNMAMELTVMQTIPALGYMDTLKSLGFYLELHNDPE